MEKKVKKQKRKSIGAKYRDKAFANEFVKNGFNGKKAAIAVGHSPHTAAVIASKKLNKVNVLEELEKLQKPAIEKLNFFVSGGDEEEPVKQEIQIRAVENILDRTGFGRNSKIEHSGNVANINIDVTSMSSEELDAKLNELTKK